jgi:hypothetical protein
MLVATEAWGCRRQCVRVRASRAWRRRPGGRRPPSARFACGGRVGDRRAGRRRAGVTSRSAVRVDGERGRVQTGGGEPGAGTVPTDDGFALAAPPSSTWSASTTPVPWEAARRAERCISKPSSKWSRANHPPSRAPSTGSPTGNEILREACAQRSRSKRPRLTNSMMRRSTPGWLRRGGANQLLRASRRDRARRGGPAGLSRELHRGERTGATQEALARLQSGSSSSRRRAQLRPAPRARTPPSRNRAGRDRRRGPTSTPPCPRTHQVRGAQAAPRLPAGDHSQHPAGLTGAADRPTEIARLD